MGSPEDRIFPDVSRPKKSSVSVSPSGCPILNIHCRLFWLYKPLLTISKNASLLQEKLHATQAKIFKHFLALYHDNAMNTNFATSSHQNIRSSHHFRRRISIRRRLIICPSPYRLHRQSPLFNPRSMNRALPRLLPRDTYPVDITQPPLHEVDIEAFNRMWPEYGGAPPAFVRDALPIKGRQMLHNVRNTKIIGHSNSEDSEECRVLFKGPVYNDNDVPSHVLAVTQGGNVIFLPVHEIIFAANCATLPYFPYSSSSMDNLPDQFTLPVVKLEVPSLSSFHVLHEYLYTKEVGRLRRLLTPPSHATSTTSLYYQTGFIRDLWKNACTLCVVDCDLYSVLRDLYREAWNNIRRMESTF